MPDLFDSDPKHAPGARRAPKDLNPAEWRELRRWAEERVPWLTRGALGATASLEEYVDACLSHFRQSTKRRAGWVETCQNWVRTDERRRVERMANGGNDAARLALRDPAAWRVQHDRKLRLTAEVVRPPELIVPATPATNVVSLSARRSA